MKNNIKTDGIYLPDQLRAKEKEILMEDFIELVFAAGSVLPISTRLPSGIRGYEYKIKTNIGMSKIIENASTDIPMVDIDYKAVYAKIVNTANSFSFSNRDIRSAEQGGVPLDLDLLMSSKEAAMVTFNDIIQYGSALHSVVGLYNNPNITEYAVSTVGTGSPNTAWLVGGVAKKTPDQIIADVNGIISSVRILSKNRKRVNKLLLPLEHEAYIATTPRSANSDLTILQFLKANNPRVEFIALPELSKDNLSNHGIKGPDKSSALTGAMMVAMSVSVDTVEVQLTMPYTIYKPQDEKLGKVVYTEMEHGGCEVKKPYAFAYGKNI